jgi:hypothetical protein
MSVLSDSARAIPASPLIGAEFKCPPKVWKFKGDAAGNKGREPAGSAGKNSRETPESTWRPSGSVLP